jgi:hypothetical protein
VSPSAGESFDSLALQPSGRVVAGGSLNTDWHLARFTKRGRLDESFSRDGQVRTGLGGNTDELGGVLSLPDGRLFAVGSKGSLGFRSNFYELAIARYLDGGRRHDADADGRVDRLDRCPRLGASAHGGCPFYRRSLRARVEESRLMVTISSLASGCGHDSVARLFRVGNGDDSLVQTKTPKRRVFHFDLPPRGSYYVKVLRNVVAGTGICGAARSDPVSSFAAGSAG